MCNELEIVATPELSGGAGGKNYSGISTKY